MLSEQDRQFLVALANCPHLQTTDVLAAAGGVLILEVATIKAKLERAITAEKKLEEDRAEAARLRKESDERRKARGSENLKRAGTEFGGHDL